MPWGFNQNVDHTALCVIQGEGIQIPRWRCTLPIVLRLLWDIMQRIAQCPDTGYVRAIAGSCLHIGRSSSSVQSGLMVSCI